MQQCCNVQIHHGNDLQYTVVNIEIRWDDGTGTLTAVSMYMHIHTVKVDQQCSRLQGQRPVVT